MRESPQKDYELLRMQYMNPLTFPVFPSPILNTRVLSLFLAPLVLPPPRLHSAAVLSPPPLLPLRSPFLARPSFPTSVILRRSRTTPPPATPSTFSPPPPPWHWHPLLRRQQQDGGAEGGKGGGMKTPQLFVPASDFHKVPHPLFVFVSCRHHLHCRFLLYIHTREHTLKKFPLQQSFPPSFY